MLIRIVKMTFDKRNTATFIESFKSVQKSILDFKGCHHVELLRDDNDLNIFFTYSYWDSEEDLNDYRRSDFFLEVWSRTKSWFSEKPEAWSLNRIVDMTEINN